MDKNFLKVLGKDFYNWSKGNEIGKIPAGVAREGAGENRIPFAHLANSVPVYLTLTKLLIESKNKNVSVLDVGCGTGRNISFVKERVNKSDYLYYGIDYSRSCINFAKTQYGKKGVVFKKHSGNVMPFKDRSFDFIVSSHVLEHIPIPNVNTYFNEISRILKKGGVAVIGTPNRKYCQDLFHKNPTDSVELRLILPHLHEYYLDELRMLLNKGKWFSKFSIDQTKNEVNRKLMTKSINNIKPRKDLIGKIIFKIYSTLRKNKNLQDIMARYGTEMVLKSMGANYIDLVSKTTYILNNRKDIGDNFIIVAKK